MLCRCICITASARLLYLPDKPRFDLAVTDRFHHRQVLEVVMCLEESVAGKELDEDATDTPYIAREAPAKVKYYFWSTVMPCTDDGAMVLIVECR